MTILLIAYAVFVLIFIIYSISGIYHLWRFGYVGDLTKPAIVIYVILSIGVIAMTVLTFIGRDWSSII